MYALTIKGLRKTYRSGVEALKGIDLQVEQGDFFGLLGPNGAGKSTTISIVSSLIPKTSGQVQVFAHDIDKELNAAKRCIGLVPQEFNFNMFEKVIQIVVNQAGFYGIPRKLALQRAEKYLTKLGLWEKRNAVARSLSGGMKRRLMIARGLIHEPKLLILDEPTAGVDIEIRRSMWDFLTEINQQGTTIILTTHYLEEAESLCNNLAIIDKGIIIENTSTRDLLDKLHVETFVFYLQHFVQEAPMIDGLDVRLVDKRTIEIQMPKDYKLSALFHRLAELNIQVESMRNKHNRLEELFIRLVKREGEPHE